MFTLMAGPRLPGPAFTDTKRRYRAGLAAALAALLALCIGAFVEVENVHTNNPLPYIGNEGLQRDGWDTPDLLPLPSPKPGLSPIPREPLR